jgi:glyoxylase I family protein
MPQLLGLSHIDLTVTDCARAASWWADVLGFTLFNQVRTESYECRSLMHPSGLVVTVMTHDGTADDGAFDERRVGLDHLAFQVTDTKELECWVEHLDACDVSHTEVIDTGYGPTVVFRDPDNMQLELFVHPKPDELADVTDAQSAEPQAILRAPPRLSERAQIAH